MNWKALGLSVLTMGGIFAFVGAMIWVSVTFGAVYALLPIPIVGGLILFYVLFDE